MMSATASVMRNHPAEAWRRHLTIMLDGLRAPAS